MNDSHPITAPLVRFLSRLRDRGVQVPSNAGITAGRALMEVGITSRMRVRSALKSSLISRPGDLDVFDRLFPRFWKDLREETSTAGETGDEIGHFPEGLATRMPPDPADDLPGDGDVRPNHEHGSNQTQMHSDVGEEEDPSPEVTETASVSTYSPGGSRRPVEISGLYSGFDHREWKRFAEAIALKPGRRHSPAREGGEIDVRRSLRRSFQTGGRIMRLSRKKRERSISRTCVLVDVSRSVLDTLNETFLMEFLRAMHRYSPSSRIFFYDTEIREVTDIFEGPGPEGSLHRLAAEIAEWGGGTRIGHALQHLRRRAPFAVDSTTGLIMISDGLDRGEMDELESGMAWLRRLSGFVFWLNPLATSPDYEPACRGMKRALPHVDGLFAYAGPGDLDEIARQVHRRGPHGSIGYRFDPRREPSDV